MSDSHASWMEEARAHLIRYAGTFSPLLAVKAEGSFFYTSDGRKILDFTSGQMCSIFGHNPPGLLESIHWKVDMTGVNLTRQLYGRV